MTSAPGMLFTIRADIYGNDGLFAHLDLQPIDLLIKLYYFKIK